MTDPASSALQQSVGSSAIFNGGGADGLRATHNSIDGCGFAPGVRAVNEVRQSVQSGTPVARRRYLTILFSDLSDSTRIAGGLEAEEYSSIIERFRAKCHAAIESRGGTIAQISGDGILAIFGHPKTQEGDGRRATEAAIELHEAMRQLDGENLWRGVKLRLHTGIHSGLVLLDSGDPLRGRFELLGTATNIASRLCGLAGADEILVSEATLGPERHFFETSDRRYLDVKGRDKPIAVLTVLGRSSVTSRFAARGRGGLTPFVGRQAELRALKRTLGQAMKGAVRLVSLTAPAGVGKTRLAEELLRHAVRKGCEGYRGECEAGAEPLQPFLQILRSIFGLGPQVPPAAGAALLEKGLAALDSALLVRKPVLLRLLSLSANGAADRKPRPSAEENAEALRDVFAKLAERRPLVLFIDDWQWADDAARHVLNALRRIEAQPILVLLTLRSGPAVAEPMNGTQVIALAPFTGSETAEAVKCLLPAANPFRVADIRSASGGNPLYIEELCHSLARGDAEEGPGGGSAWLENLIESRLSRLPAVQADLVRAAAVIGNIIPSWLLELVTGCGEKDPLVTALAAEDFIFPGERDGTLRFKHGITRDAIYDSVGLRERRALHLHIAEALRARPDHGEEEPYEALAYHYGAGGDAAATAHYAELAGDKAFTVSALDRAQVQYRAALGALDRLPEADETSSRWGRIAQKFARAGVFDPSRDQLPIFERAVEMAVVRHDPTALIWAEYWLGYINYALGEPIAAIYHYERALEAALAAGDQRLIVQIRAAMGQTRQAACDYEKALPLLDEAIEAKRRSSGGASPGVGIAYSLSCKGFALGDMGRFAEARAYFEEAMAAIGGARSELEASVLDQRSAVCLWQGRMEEALQFAQEGERLGERIRSVYDFAMSRALAGYARWKMGGAPAAVQTIVEATSWLEVGGRNQCISLNYGWLAEAMVDSGRAAEARGYAARALLRARKHDTMGLAMALRAMARAAARESWRKSPEYYLARAMAASRARRAPHEVAVTQLCAAELALAAGERDRALALLAEARQAFAAMGMAWHDREASRVAGDADRSA
jgi:class 3 adenylate cyclase/tetratricopeptide (TPR) repeat protein